tara:strand:- start:62 stop:1144 length:1083 start_codon:yes stop_codon:yes gene_type:complete
MFILLKHTNKFKGICCITHVEANFKNLMNFITNYLSKYYYIYGVWCNGYPSNLKTKLATYFTDNIFYYNPKEDIKPDFILLMQLLGVNIHNYYEKRYFDFINIGRCCERKNTLGILNVMIYAARNYDKKSLLVLVNDQGNKQENYKNNIITIYNKLPEAIKDKIILIKNIPIKNDSEYCIENSFNYKQLSLLFKSTKIYIHNTRGFDEARIIGQAALSGCKILINKNMIGHVLLRKLNNTVVEFDNTDINKKIKKILLLSDKNNFNDLEIINKIYNEDVTVIKELKRYYKECKYNNILDFNYFYNLCDKKQWSLKIAAHFVDVPWYIREKNNPTHHIMSNEQLILLKKYIMDYTISLNSN